MSKLLLVPLEDIPRAIASVTSAGQTARIVGPALGGVLYGLGPTTVYAFMQAMGLVNDHLDRCDARDQAELARAEFDRPG